MDSDADFYDRIENSGFPSRLIGILHKAGITHVSDLYEMSDAEIQLLPNVGAFYLQEVREHQRKARVMSGCMWR